MTELSLYSLVEPDVISDIDAVLQNEKTRRPLVSVFGTVYNNIKTVRKSILSISRVLDNLPHEIVIIDNYSTDGTFEELLKLKKEGIPLRVYRLKCSRGAGRHIAAKLAKGELLVYADFDCIYTPVLKLIIEEALGTRKAINLVAIPKEVYTVTGGFRNLNRAEDIDLWARMHNRGLCLYVPPLKVWVRLEIELPGLFSLFRELRYAGGLKYLKRFLINRISQTIGGAITLKKLIREGILLHRKNIINILSEVISFLPFIFLVKVTRWKNMFCEQHRDLSNYVYVEVMNLCNMIVPSFLLKMPHLINIHYIRKAISFIRYVSRFDVNIAKDAYSRLHLLLKEITKAIRKRRI